MEEEDEKYFVRRDLYSGAKASRRTRRMVWECRRGEEERREEKKEGGYASAGSKTINPWEEEGDQEEVNSSGSEGARERGMEREERRCVRRVVLPHPEGP